MTKIFEGEFQGATEVVDTEAEKADISKTIRSALAKASLIPVRASLCLKSTGIPFVNGTELTIDFDRLTTTVIPALTQHRCHEERENGGRGITRIRRDGHAAIELLLIAQQRGIIGQGRDLTITSLGAASKLSIRQHEWDLTFDDALFRAIRTQLLSDHVEGKLPPKFRRLLSKANEPCKITCLFSALERELLTYVKRAVETVIHPLQDRIDLVMS